MLNETETISLHQKSSDINQAGHHYGDSVIEPMVPNSSRHGNTIIFENDNARAHQPRVVQGPLQFRRITTLPKSPDLSSIEYFLDILGRCVRRRPHKPQDINELADVLQEERRWIPKTTTGRFIRSIGGGVAWRRLEGLLAIETSVKLLY